MVNIKQLLHASLIVSDLGRSRAFYEDLLGFAVNPARPALSFAGIWYDIGENQIHLMVLPDPDADSVRPAHGGRDYHVAFSVESIEPLRAALDAAGVSYTSSMSGRAAIFCRDPDGNALEFSAL